MADLIENYIYLYHLGKEGNFILLPTYPQQISDTLQANFSQTNPLSRSAPIFSYSNSGPRTMQINLSLHRDMMSQLNYNLSDYNLSECPGEDYVDRIIAELQAIALPRYDDSLKMVNPPMVAIRFGNEIYIKGIVNGSVSVEYSGPILPNNKYALVNISFTVTEVDPYDAETVAVSGSFRGLNKTLERRLYKNNK